MSYRTHLVLLREPVVQDGIARLLRNHRDLRPITAGDDFAEVIYLLESVTAMLRDEQQQKPDVVDGTTESGQDG